MDLRERLNRTPRGLIIALAVTSATLIGGVVPDVIRDIEFLFSWPTNSTRVPQFIVRLFGFLAALVFTYIGWNKRVMARVYNVGTADADTARKGLLLLVAPVKGLGPEELRAKMLAALNGAVEAAAFGSQTKAIVAHINRLEHVWLIATDESFEVAKTLSKVTMSRYPGIQVHVGPEFLVKDPYSDQAVAGTQAIALKIFEQAKGFNLSDRMIVADITGATKPMTLGLAFACMDNDRDIQYTSEKVNMFGFETRVDA